MQSQYDSLYARTEHGTFRHHFEKPYYLDEAREIARHLLRGHKDWFNVKLEHVNGTHFNTVE